MLRRGAFSLALILLCVLALVASVASARDHARHHRITPRPFEPAEQLIYEGEFSKLLLRGVKIAQFRFTAGRAQATANTHERDISAADGNLLLTGEAVSEGWFRKLFGIQFRFRIESTIEPNSLAVLRTSKLDEQGRRVRTSEAIFDRVENKITWTERNPNDPASPPRVVTSPLNGASHDIISALYFLRTMPLAVGQSFELLVSDSGAVYHIPVKVIEKKRMKTVLGKVSALRVDAEIFGDQRLVRGNGEMSLWITDDARRLPVRARVSNSMGTVDITLKSVTKGAQVSSSIASRLPIFS